MTMPTSGDDAGESRSDIDRRFSEIIADYGPTPPVEDQASPPVAPAPAAAPWRGQSTAAHEETTVGAVNNEEEEHFVPAPPDPLPAGDLHFWAIVVGLTVGPILVFLSAALSVIPGMPFGALGVILTVVGFVLLVLRSPRRRSGDEGSGARV
ncbi:MAG: hypothetical protein WBG36_06410 [Ornithinimicrobium sp.]